jgi:hypothetical protein
MARIKYLLSLSSSLSPSPSKHRPRTNDLQQLPVASGGAARLLFDESMMTGLALVDLC